ncbi:MAG: RNA polymerase sigma factor [Lachnospiraceae bacterium]|nr:RNA polymerase sigma factor [Lachnospiraceae bacterium]
MDKREKRPFEEVYDEYYDKVYRTVYMRILCRENTEDIVQDTFVKAMSAYDRFDPAISSVYTWISTIATNALYDYFRKTGSDKVISLEGYLEAGYEPGDADPELEKLTDGYARSAYLILRHLNAKERELLSMRFGREMSYKEMADCLSSNEKAVGMKMTRLFEKCRRIAKEEKIKF